MWEFKSTGISQKASSSKKMRTALIFVILYFTISSTITAKAVRLYNLATQPTPNPYDKNLQNSSGGGRVDAKLKIIGKNPMQPANKVITSPATRRLIRNTLTNFATEWAAHRAAMVMTIKEKVAAIEAKVRVANTVKPALAGTGSIESGTLQLVVLLVQFSITQAQVH